MTMEERGVRNLANLTNGINVRVLPDSATGLPRVDKKKVTPPIHGTSECRAY